MITDRFASMSSLRRHLVRECDKGNAELPNGGPHAWLEIFNIIEAQANCWATRELMLDIVDRGPDGDPSTDKVLAHSDALAALEQLGVPVRLRAFTPLVRSAQIMQAKVQCFDARRHLMTLQERGARIPTLEAAEIACEAAQQALAKLEAAVVVKKS